MPQIMEHASSQSLVIQNPRLPVREGQPVYPHLTEVPETPESQQWQNRPHCSPLFGWMPFHPMKEPFSPAKADYT